MRRNIRLLALLVALVLAAVANLTEIQAQATLQLPADIVFETWTQISYPFLVRLDAHTLKWTLFYAKKNSDVHLISWSPKGNMLAIFQDSGHLCILSRTGKLVSCMENQVDGIANSGNGVGGNNYLYTVAWSNDETKLYYITDIPSIGGNPQFLEADVATGKTLRVLYDQSDMDPYMAIPAPNGKALLLRGYYGPIPDTINFIQFPTATGQNATQGLVRQNLNAQLTPPIGFNSASPQNLQDNPATHQRQFCSFSPKGTYFTAYDAGVVNGNDILPYEFDIFDANGRLQRQVRPESYPNLPIPLGCPAWAPDESVFYFGQGVQNTAQDGYYAVYYKYTLSNGKIEPYFTKPDALDVYTSPAEVSPDGNYLLYEDAGGQDINYETATVIGPNNTIASFPGIFGYSKHPLWVPPLQP